MSKEKNTSVKQRKKPVEEAKNDTKTVKSKSKDGGKQMWDNLECTENIIFVHGGTLTAVDFIIYLTPNSLDF